MRCRAWLGVRYCKNHTRSTCCHVHCHNKPYRLFLNLLPDILIQKIANFIVHTEEVQNFRQACSWIHSTIRRLPISCSKEYMFFSHLFASENIISYRQLHTAARRFEDLGPSEQGTIISLFRPLPVRGYPVPVDLFQNDPHFLSLLTSRKH